MASSEWEANQARLTAFPTPTAGMDGVEWWQRVTGEPPDTAIDSPKIATHQIQGKFQAGALALQIQPLRVDWLYAALTPEGLPDLSGTLGLLSGVSAQFLELMAKWLTFPDCPPLQRIAFGAALLIPVESRQIGYAKLGSYLPYVELDAEHSSDFSYQINRPRQSAVVSTASVNRLSKWSVSAFQTMLASPAGIALGLKLHACRVELDVNTTPESATELPKAKLADLFRELVALAGEIAEKGDVP